MSTVHATPTASLYRPPVEVIARWSAPRRDGTLTTCDGCGYAARVGEHCTTCYQLAGTGHVGHLAVVVVTAGRRCTVVAERTPDGRWSPVSVLDARGSTIRAIRREATDRAAPAQVTDHPTEIPGMKLA